MARPPYMKLYIEIKFEIIEKSSKTLRDFL